MMLLPKESKLGQKLWLSAAFARAKKETLQEAFFKGTLSKDLTAIVDHKSSSKPLFLVPLLALTTLFILKS